MAWWHQAITQTDDLVSVMSIDISKVYFHMIMFLLIIKVCFKTVTKALISRNIMLIHMKQSLVDVSKTLNFSSIIQVAVVDTIKS